MRNYKYFWSLLPGVIVVAGNVMGGWWGMSNLIFSFGILALIEWFFPEDKSNVPGESEFIPDLVLVLHFVMQLLALGSLFLAIADKKFQPAQLLLASLSTGVHSGSSAIVVAHEMIHRKHPLWQWLGKLLLWSAGNVYFFVEHLRVHHKYVGTMADPATANYNESLYAFFFRTTVQQTSGAWKMESQRIKSEHRSFFYHYVFMSMVLLVIGLTLLKVTLDWTAVVAFLIQAVVANFLLEYTNYIEHYGLSRSAQERVKEIHSWQSDKVISRFFLVDLSRHSDHHYYASKPYHQLETYENSPVLPGGYASAIYMAVLPPLWFKVMNKRIHSFKEKLSHG